MQRVQEQLTDSTIREQQLQAEVASQQEVVRQRKREIARYQALVKLYEEAERLAKIQRFASSSERSKFQFQLFDEAELEQAIDDLDQQIEQAEPGNKKSEVKSVKVFHRICLEYASRFRCQNKKRRGSLIPSSPRSRKNWTSSRSNIRCSSIGKRKPYSVNGRKPLTNS